LEVLEVQAADKQGEIKGVQHGWLQPIVSVSGIAAVTNGPINPSSLVAEEAKRVEEAVEQAVAAERRRHREDLAEVRNPCE
jgi:hypothetical protein